MKYLVICFVVCVLSVLYLKRYMDIISKRKDTYEEGFCGGLAVFAFFVAFCNIPFIILDMFGL